jgi:hypothetical protein
MGEEEDEEEDYGALIYRESQLRKAEAAAVAAAKDDVKKKKKKKNSHSTGCQNSIHFLKYGDDNVDNNYYITADYADATGAGRSLVDRIKV